MELYIKVHKGGTGVARQDRVNYGQVNHGASLSWGRRKIKEKKRKRTTNYIFFYLTMVNKICISLKIIIINKINK